MSDDTRTSYSAQNIKRPVMQYPKKNQKVKSLAMPLNRHMDAPIFKLISQISGLSTDVKN